MSRDSRSSCSTLQDLETRLRLQLSLSWSAVEVTVSLPNLVSVNIAERQPVVRWEQEAVTHGSRRMASHSVRAARCCRADLCRGAISPDRGRKRLADPLTPAPFISPEMVRALKGLAGHVPPGMPILYDASFGFGWNDPRGWRVYFGTSASDVELKMRVYESMVNSLTQRGIRPALINVTYPTAPYYRMSQ